MDQPNRFTREELIKWKTVYSRASLKRALARIHNIQSNPPVMTAKLLSYGTPSYCFESKSAIIRLSFEKLELKSLFQLKNHLNTKQKEVFCSTLYRTLEYWRVSGFIHGDLSPRNILIDLSKNEVFFVDWILDLESFEATPQYAAKEVYQKRRSWFSDWHSADIICRELLDSKPQL